MAEPPLYPDSGAEPERESAGMPGWVKVLGIAVIIVVLLVVAMLLVGGGGHTPPAGAH